MHYWCIIFVFKRFSDAVKSGNHVLTVINGFETSDNMDCLKMWNNILEKVLVSSRMKISEIDYIELDIPQVFFNSILSSFKIINPRRNTPLLMGTHIFSPDTSDLGILIFIKLIISIKAKSFSKSLSITNNLFLQQIPAVLLLDDFSWNSYHNNILFVGISSQGVIFGFIICSPPKTEIYSYVTDKFHLLPLSATLGMVTHFLNIFNCF